MRKRERNNLNHFFSRNIFRCCFENGFHPIYEKVIQQYVVDTQNKSNYDLCCEVYNILKKKYRNEYYYKNTLLNKLLLGVHSLNTTTALTELPVADCKADFILINGKAVVYEIKTELDNFDRLEKQIHNYYKAFDHVAVVSYKESLNDLRERIALMNKPVGIYVLQRRGTISTIEKPKRYRKDLDLGVLFGILRKNEYEKIILDHYGYLPEVSEFKYYSECKELFQNMSIEEAYSASINLLKQREMVLKDEFQKIPYELKYLAYFMDLKAKEYRQISKFLNESYGGG